MPRYVTWSFPSGRLTVPSHEEVTPGPAAGLAPGATRSGGQCALQALVHLTTFLASAESW